MIRRTALLLIAFAGCLSCVAQDLDSLRAAWRNPALADSLRYKACYDLVWDGYLFSDPDSGLLLANELQTTARKSGSAQYDALAYDLQAVAWYVKGDLRKALALYAISLPMHETRGDVGSMADVIGNMGSMHLYLGEHKEALALYEKALKVHAERADTLAMANDINAMGAVYMARGEHGRAIEHYTRGLRMLHAIGNERGIATGLTNLGTVHRLQGDPRAALPRYAEALALAERLGDKDQMATILGEIGTCHEELGDSTNAMAAFQRSYGLNEELGDQRGVVTILNKMGGLSMTMGRPSEAWNRFHEAMVIAKEHDLSFGHATALIGAGNAAMRLGRSSEALMLADRAASMVRTSDEVSLKRDAAELLYRLHRAAGRTQQALLQHEAYVLYRDSILREADQRETLHAQYAYDQERRSLSDSLKHQSETHALNLAHAASLVREQQRRTWLMAAVLIAMLVAAGIWWRLRHAERTNRTIRAAQALVVEAERQRENEAVRTRIARDLHDEMGGDLTKIGLLSTEAQHGVETNGTLSETLVRIAELARGAHGALHDVVHATDASTDSSTALVEHARTIAHRLLDRSAEQHTIDVDHIGVEVPVGPATKRDLLMILKEAINNALKHAQAEHIDVVFRLEHGRYTLEVADDGKGFDPALANGGNGLRNMRARAERLGAYLALDRNGTSGTRILLTLTNG